MKYLNRDMVAQVLNSLDSPFDAHLVEEGCRQRYPVAVADELSSFGNSPDPLRQFSAAFAQRLGREFASQIQKTSKVKSENLRGRVSRNQQWTRIGVR